MVKDGYGVCYAVTSDQYVSSYLTVLSTVYIYIYTCQCLCMRRLKFIVTSWKTCPNTNAAAFRSGLLESISDFKSLLASAE